MRHLTLTTRLSVFFLSTLAIILAGFSTALYLIAAKYLDRQVDERLDAVLNTISGIIEIEPDGVEWEPGNRHLNLDFSMLGDQIVWWVADDHGQLLDRSRGGDAEAFLAEIPVTFQLVKRSNEVVKWKSKSWEAGQRWIHAEKQSTEPVGDSQQTPSEVSTKPPALSITAGVSLRPVRATLTKLATTLAGLSAGIGIVAFLVGRFVCRRALFPLKQMAVAATEIDSEDFAHQRLPRIATEDELGDLNRAFNNLLDRMQETFERQQRFTGDASHQLRTPLTAILGHIDVVLRRPRPVEECREVLGIVRQKAGQLAKTVESLLFLARANSESRKPVLEPVNLTEWLPQFLLGWADHVRASDLTFESVTTGPVTIFAHHALLQELLTILIDNACKFSDPGTPIKIQLESSNDLVFVKVDDRGWGIETSDLETIFIPFFRSEQAFHRRIEGVGLGLSIARRLTEAFDGRLTVTSNPGKGSCFILQFPTSASNAVAGL